MIRNILTMSAVAIMLVFTTSCKDKATEANEAETEAQATAQAITYDVDTELSSIAWVGSKPTEDHKGNLSLASGSVKVLDETLQSGEFTIDMTSIEVTDLEGEEAANLKAHLEGTLPGKATDFFNTPKYPTAKFVVTGVKSVDGKTMLEGNLTLKAITKNVAFPVTVTYDDTKMMLTSEEFTIDRTDWDIQYGSQKFSDKILDSAIGDNMKLTVNIVAKKA